MQDPRRSRDQELAGIGGISYPWIRIGSLDGIRLDLDVAGSGIWDPWDMRGSEGSVSRGSGSSGIKESDQTKGVGSKTLDLASCHPSSTLKCVNVLFLLLHVSPAEG